jgi:alkaline phosphatase D
LKRLTLLLVVDDDDGSAVEAEIPKLWVRCCNRPISIRVSVSSGGDPRRRAANRKKQLKSGSEKTCCIEMIRGIARWSVGFSTILLRLLAYIFLRWIPSHVLWPVIIFLWILFIVSFITLLYLDLEASLPVVTIEETDVVEIVDTGAEPVAVETEIETITVEQPRETKSGSWMETVYLGIPNSNPLLSVATALFNASLLLMTLDLTFRAYLFHPATDLAFHRPIPTSPYSTNIFIRSPPEAPLPLRIFYKPLDNLAWHTGPIADEFENHTDYTSVIPLNGLRPGTRYEYAVLPPNISIDDATNYSFYGTFETFPRRGKGGRWSFGSSSCIKPGLPYNPLGHPLRLKGVEHLETEIPNIKFFAFLGSHSISLI